MMTTAGSAVTEDMETYFTYSGKKDVSRELVSNQTGVRWGGGPFSERARTQVIAPSPSGGIGWRDVHMGTTVVSPTASQGGLPGSGVYRHLTQTKQKSPLDLIKALELATSL